MWLCWCSNLAVGLIAAHLPRPQMFDKRGTAATEQLYVHCVGMGGKDPLGHITSIACKYLQYRTVEEDPQVDAFPLLEIDWG